MQLTTILIIHRGSAIIIYKSNRALFPCLHSLIFKHSEDWETSRKLHCMQTLRHSRGFGQMYRILPTLIMFRQGYVNKQKVFYCPIFYRSHIIIKIYLLRSSLTCNFLWEDDILAGSPAETGVIFFTGPRNKKSKYERSVCWQHLPETQQTPVFIIPYKAICSTVKCAYSHRIRY